jgi:ABC-type Mn2+/Zn2+ transport system permease subunit
MAHGVLPGVAGAMLLNVPSMLGAAVGATVLVGGVGVITRRTRLSGDTAIGLLFVGMLSLGVVLTSRSASFNGDITRLLFGEVLGIRTEQLWWQALVLVVVAFVAWLCRRPFLLLSIDADLATTSGFSARKYNMVMMALIAGAILSSFQAVGTLLVFGMLIAPAATAALFSRRLTSMMFIAGVIGSLSVYVGLTVSYHYDVAASAAIVLVAVGIFAVGLLVASVRRDMSRHVEPHVHAHPAHGHEHEVGHVH